MNTLKPLLICAVLAGIGYGVYVRINGGNDTPPPGAPQDLSGPPEIQLGDAAAPGGQPAFSGASASSTAPPFGAAPGGPAAPAGGEAPPFAPAAPTPDPNAGVNSAAPPFENPAAPAAAGAALPAEMPANQAPAEASPPVADAAAPPAVPDRYNTSAPVQNRYVTQGAADHSPQAPAAPDGAAPPDASAAAAAQAPGGSGYPEMLETVRRELESGQLASALEKLSAWHDDTRLTPEEQQELNQLLDQVAGTVVYSTQHLMEPPYEVQAGERLEDIAQKFEISPQLLAKINGIEDPNALRPGERLKVVRGPFNAVVNLQKRELTITLPNGAYAGRFPIGLGTEQPAVEGTYAVSDKLADPVYRGREKVVGAGDVTNPYGHRWIGLGTGMGIHGTDRAENIGRTDLPGSISLSPQDIEDVYDILATGSKVTIRR